MELIENYATYNGTRYMEYFEECKYELYYFKEGELFLKRIGSII